MSSISDTYFGLQRYPNSCNTFLCNTDTLQYGHFYLLQFSWFCCPYSDLAKVLLDVFERRASTGNGRFAILSSGCAQIFRKIVSIRVKTLPRTLPRTQILVASRRHSIREKASLPGYVHRSKTCTFA